MHLPKLGVCRVHSVGGSLIGSYMLRWDIDVGFGAIVKTEFNSTCPLVAELKLEVLDYAASSHVPLISSEGKFTYLLSKGSSGCCAGIFDYTLRNLVYKRENRAKGEIFLL